ncbi:MAG: hypothetical protein GY870_17660 [archaeon]|nr:hypothetical protein [archaeon]
MSAINQKLVEILKELEKNSEVFGSALVTTRGQMMASALHNDIPEKSVAAMSAALTSVASRVGKTLQAGATKSIVINGEDRLIFVNELGKAVLISLAPADAKVGLIDFELDNTMEKLKATLG